mgnify:CR=1 FL=1|jgi:hypothetical protein
MSRESSKVFSILILIILLRRVTIIIAFIIILTSSKERRLRGKHFPISSSILTLEYFLQNSGAEKTDLYYTLYSQQIY